VKRLLVLLAKIAGVLTSAVSFAAIGAIVAFLVTYYLIDRSEPENPGTDLGAGFAFGFLLVGGILIGGIGGTIFGSWRFFKPSTLPMVTSEVR
jgi:hypothetical protein